MFKTTQEGEQRFIIEGLSGSIEGILTIPPDYQYDQLVLLGHPHSLQGGSMQNKVVTTMARAFKEKQIASIRFNFRGVGQSAGVYDNGVGESEDMMHLARLWKEQFPECRLLFAGFSFGSYVSYRAAAQMDSQLLISIAPPVHHYDYRQFAAPLPWHIIQGDEDDVVPLDVVETFVQQFSPPLPLYRFAETGHFFHGKLLELKEVVQTIITRLGHTE